MLSLRRGRRARLGEPASHRLGGAAGLDESERHDHGEVDDNEASREGVAGGPEPRVADRDDRYIHEGDDHPHDVGGEDPECHGAVEPVGKFNRHG